MIKLSKCGCLARVKKQNEIIKALNPLLRLEMRYGDKLQTHYSDNNVVLEIPNLELLSLALEDIQAETSSHPWKVTSNGDSTVAVASGKVYWFDGNSSPLVMKYHKAAAASVTVTGAGGFIYYQYTTEQYQIQNETLANESLEGYSNGRFSSSGSFVFQSAAETVGSQQDPNGITTVYILIAEVTLAGGVATIDEQVAQENISPLMHYFLQGS